MVAKKRNGKDCRFCQRSRWLMVVTMLVVMIGIVIINQPG
jgi:hypothetical protein